MDPNYQGAQPSVVAELVAYIVKPEAYFMTGKRDHFVVTRYMD